MLNESRLNQVKKLVRDIIFIVAGSAIYALSISVFLNPNNLAPGGVSGVSIMINYIAGIPTGAIYFCLNVPVMILGLWKLGVRFSAFTLAAVAMSSGFMEVFANIDSVTDNMILAGIFGGALSAVGIGLVFRGGATTGGTDIIVRVIRKKYKHLKSGQIFLYIDCAIAAVSAIVYNDIETALYAFLALYTSSVVLDKVLYGADGAKMVYIVTDHGKEIADIVLRKLDIGVTFLDGEGAYSGRRKEILMCVMHKPLMPKVKDIVKSVDDRAFMIVSPATEIFGEGYKQYDAEEL